MKGIDFEIKDNMDGTITKTMNGEEYVYNILVGGNIPEGESIIDYRYSQFDDKLQKVLVEEKIPTRKFCSGTCVAMILAISRGDSSIRPEDVATWVYKDGEKTVKEVNWNGGLKDWEMEKDLENDGGQVYDNKQQDEITKEWHFKSVDGDIKNNADYLKEIKLNLAAGQPVIIHVKGNDMDEHFVVVVGIEAGVELNEATFDQLVIFDPGTDQKFQIATIGNLYADYQMKDERLLTPYLYDIDINEYVYDENGKKTHDPYYVDPVKKENGSIVPSKTGRIIKDIIDLVKKLGLSDMDRAIKNMVKTATGEDIGVYINLSISENGEYVPDEGVTAFDKVVVDVKANVKSKGITENGEYRAVNDNAEGFDVVSVNVPDRSDEVEMYRDLWLKEIGEGEEIDTNIPMPGNPDDPGGNYVFDNAVDVGGDVDLEKYYPAFKAAGRADIAEITGGLGMHFETVYTSDRTDILFTLTNMKNGKSVSMNSSFFTYLDIKNDGWRLASLYVTGWYTGLFLVSGGVTYNMNLYYKDIDFTPPPNWEPHYILT